MLFKHSGQYVLAKGIPAVINLTTIAIYTRYLDPAEYGQYAVIMASVLLATSFFFQWLRMSLLRFLPEYVNNKSELLSNIFFGYAVIVGFTGIIAIASAFIQQDLSTAKTLMLGTLLFWLNGWFEINLELLRSELKPAVYGYISLTKAIAGLIISGGLAYKGLGADGVILGLIISIVVIMPWLIKGGWLSASVSLINVELIRKVLYYGLPLTITFAASSLTNSLDRYQLSIMDGLDTVGLYSVASDFGRQSILVLMMTINLAAFPLALRALESKGVDAARQQMSQNWTLLLTTSIPICLLMMLFSSEISSLIFGSSFTDSSTALIPWITLGTLFLGLRMYYFDQSFYISKSPGYQLVIVVATIVAKFIFNLILIPTYGALGAAYSGVAAFGMSLVFCTFLSQRAFRLDLNIGASIKILMASGLMVFIAINLKSLISDQLFMLNAIFVLGLYFMFVYMSNIGGYKDLINKIVLKLK